MVRGNGVEYNCNGNPVNLCLSSWKVLWLLSQEIIWQLYFEQFLKKYVFLQGIYLLDIFNMLTLPLIVHKFTANTISSLRILWSKM